MCASRHSDDRWEQIVEELRAYRRTQAEAWGNLDDTILASYIAGTCNEAERVLVENTMQNKPEVRRLIDLAQRMSSPIVWIDAPDAVRAGLFLPKGTMSVLCESLRVSLDQTGSVVASGLESLMGELGGIGEPAVAATPLGLEAVGAPDQDLIDDSGHWSSECCWTIPVARPGYTLKIRARPGNAKGHWDLNFDMTSDVDPRIPQRARFSLSQPDDIPMLESVVSRYGGKDIEIAAGTWNLAITVDVDVRVLPLELA